MVCGIQLVELYCNIKACSDLKMIFEAREHLKVWILLDAILADFCHILDVGNNSSSISKLLMTQSAQLNLRPSVIVCTQWQMPPAMPFSKMSSLF